MAAIISASVLYQNTDSAERVVLLAVRRVTTGDTLDLSLVSLGSLFSALYSVATVVPSNRAQAAGAPTISGTVVTFAQAGLANDAVLLLIAGVAPQ
jgi:hypothetical protein